MPVPLTFKKGNQTIKKIVFVEKQDEVIWTDIGFDADELVVDEELQILSKNNSTSKVPHEHGLPLITVFPNPVTDQLRISFTNPVPQQVQVQLFNSVGQLIYQQPYQLTGMDAVFQLPFQHLARGVYYLFIRNTTTTLLEQKILK
jgi:hypothetical protein